jgi:hypothetical protein
MHRVAIAILALLMPPPGWAASPIAVSDALRFDVAGAPLFRPSTPTVFPIPGLMNQSLGPVHQGQIVHNVSQDVPVAILQSVWDQARDTCRAQSFSYDIPTNQCTPDPVTISPSQSECITGDIDRTITVTCCITPGDTPPCIDPVITPPLQESRSYRYSRDLGAGIGPRPTQPAPRPFDVGLVADYEGHANAGVEFEIALADSGLVDVDYRTAASLAADADRVPAGGVITLTSWHQPGADSAMSSKYPAFSTALRYFIDAKMKLDVEYASMDPNTGQQLHAQKNLIDFDTSRRPEGRIEGELIGIRLGLWDGLRVNFFDQVPYAPPEFDGFSFDVVGMPPGLTLPIEIAAPFRCPLESADPDLFPYLRNYSCRVVSPISFDLANYGFHIPFANTPAPQPFRGGVSEHFGQDPVPARSGLITALDPQAEDAAYQMGDLVNTIPSGFRPWGQFDPFSGKPIQEILGSGDQTRFDSDDMYAELDMDGIATLPLPGALGANLGVPPGLLNLEANAWDMDLLLWHGLEQEVRFRPNLEVDLHFDKPVEVWNEASGGWETTALVESFPVGVGSAGAANELQIRQPPGGVTVTPVYSVRNHEYHASATEKLTFGWQNEFLSLDLGGIIWEIIQHIPGVDFDLDFAVARLTVASVPAEKPVALGGPQLEGFEDQAGRALQIRELVVGDVNGDDFVDRGDINLILAARNQPSSGPDDPRDLDGDGAITVLDMRKATLLCGLPRCAPQ